MTAHHLRIPKDPLRRFCDLYNHLTHDRAWWQGPGIHTYVALTLTPTRLPIKGLRDRLEATAEELRERADWFSPLNSDSRYVVAAALLRADDTPEAFHAELTRVAPLMRARGLAPGALHEVMAVLLMRHARGRKPISDDALDRFATLVALMQSHHPWLTGPDDYPTSALLTRSDMDLDLINGQIESAYRALQEAGFSSGNALQTASHLIVLDPRAVPDTVERFQALHQAFSSRGLWMMETDYDEVAFLAMLPQLLGTVVDRVLHDREVIETLRPKHGRNASFSLACSTAFLDLIRRDASGVEFHTDELSIFQIQALIEVQDAASAAAVGSIASASV